MTYSENAQEKQSSITAPETTPERLVIDRKRRRSGSRWQRRLRRRLKKVRWASLALIVLAALAVLTVTAVALAVDSNNRVQSSLESLTRVAQSLGTKSGTDLTLNDFNRLDSSLDEMVGSLSSAAERLGFLQPFSGINGQIGATLIELEATRNLALGASQMLNGLEPTVFFLVSGDDEEQVLGGQISSGERLVELLEIGRGQFVQASDYLERARQEIDRLDLGTLSPELILYADDLDNYYENLLQVNSILLNAPEFLTNALGLNEERSYLVLSQNSDELRPSGGYISTYGWMTIRNGRVINYNYSPTTERSPNPPDEELADVYPVPDWWIRYGQPIYAAWDGSWHADFPSTAEMAMWYYNNGNNPNSPVYGVISMDILGFEQILSGIGNVTVEDYDEVVNSDNFRELVYGIRASRRDFPGPSPHKMFVAALYQSIFDQWQEMSADPEVSAQLLGEALDAIQKKDIMIYFADDSLNEAVNTLGWSGAQSPALDHDYLLVADANLGNKSNRSIFRQLTYDVDVQADGTLLSRATIAYDYSDRIAANDPAIDPASHGPRNYSNLLQVFVPFNSQFEAADNFLQEPRVVDLDAHTLFVSRVGVDYDSNERFQYTYRTPPLVETVGPYQRYRLQIQKQPGTMGDAVNIQVSLPADAETIDISPAPATRYDLDRPIIEFRFNLESDQWVEIIYKLDQ